MEMGGKFFESYYDVLRVGHDSSADEIRRAYRRLAMVMTRRTDEGKCRRDEFFVDGLPQGVWFSVVIAGMASGSVDEETVDVQGSETQLPDDSRSLRRYMGHDTTSCRVYVVGT